MKSGLRIRLALAIAAGAIIAALSVAGNINLRTRPAIPGLESRPPRAHGVDATAIRSVDGYPIRTAKDIEYILSRKAVGDPVTYVVERAGGPRTVQTRLVPFYSISPTIFLVIGLCSLGMGFVVLLLKPGDRGAWRFFWLTLAFSAAVIINGDVYGLKGPILPIVPGFIFNFAYPFAPAILMRFTRTFSDRPLKSRFRFRVTFWIGFAFGVLVNFGYLYSQLKPSYAAFQTMQRFFPLFRWYVVIACAAAVVELARSYRASVSEVVKAQIKWVFSGLIVGLGPFILLYQIPEALDSAGRWHVTPEDYVSLFFVVIPVTVTIAIMKYRLMNIDLVINRSVVYFLLTVLVVGVYLGSVEALRRVFVRAARADESWISLGAAVLAAIVFQPGRRRIQLLVDRTFFRQTFDYGKAVIGFTAAAPKIFAPDRLLRMFRLAVLEALPVEKLAVGLFEGVNEEAPAPECHGLEGPEAGAFMAIGPPPDDAGPKAREAAVRTTEGIDFAMAGTLEACGLDLLLPVPFSRPGLAGWVGLGAKKSGRRFTRDDIDLLEAMAAELASGLQRIRLQEEIVYERASREKADEIGRLKTEFISSVSHELRTPMTSLQSLSELLRSGKVNEAARRERLLELMAGECGRLSRFVHNVLDFGGIDRGTKRYALRLEPVQPIVREVVELARAGLVRDGIVIAADLPEEPVEIASDGDAVRQALINLVDNAVKYSPAGGEVNVRVRRNGGEVALEVEDRGVGIRADEREKIFEAFFRSAEASRQNPKGVGLGLAIVKHIMDGHGGRVEVQSEPGRGSVFRLIFPKGG